jgi:predicted flavoprotein YhiN
VRGETVITGYGIEGGAIYALSATLRDEIARVGHADLIVDLRPEMPVQMLRQRLDRPRGGDSLSNHLRKSLRLAPVGVSLLREAYGDQLSQDPLALATQLKKVAIRLCGVQGLERAISSAGGVDVAELDDGLMLRRVPGVFVAGEMIDWEAPTGGYLLQGCFATAHAAARGALAASGAG